MKGHPYVKSGIDVACWDILGQASGLPVASHSADSRSPAPRSWHERLVQT